MSVYQQLSQAILGYLEAFQTDLTNHDRKDIEDTHPGGPFLHWARPSGTTIVFLPPAEDYPPRGVRVPYLFGTADRFHLLHECVSLARYHNDPTNTPAQYLTHYFDGQRLPKITPAKAVQVAEDYRAKSKLNYWGFCIESHMNYLCTGINFYTRAKLAWDVQTDPEALLKDFCAQFFGPAAEPMRRYYKGLEAGRLFHGTDGKS